MEQAYGVVGDLPYAMFKHYARHRRFPHIAYTEHHIAVTLESAARPFDFFNHPFYPDFFTSDPAAELHALLSGHIDPSDRHDPVNEKLPVTQGTVDFLRKSTKKGKGKSLAEAAAFLKRGDEVDPYPKRSRPIRTLLTMKALSDIAARGQTPPLPARPADLSNSDNKHHLSLDGGPPAELNDKLDVDTILELKPRMTATQAAGLMNARTRIIEGMRKSKERAGATVKDAAIWKEWDEEYERRSKNIPRPIRPPLMPLLHEPYIKLRPVSSAPAAKEECGVTGREELRDMLGLSVDDSRPADGREKEMELYDCNRAILGLEASPFDSRPAPNSHQTRTIPRGGQWPRTKAQTSWDREVQEGHLEPITPLVVPHHLPPAPPCFDMRRPNLAYQRPNHRDDMDCDVVQGEDGVYYKRWPDGKMRSYQTDVQQARGDFRDVRDFASQYGQEPVYQAQAQDDAHPGDYRSPHAQFDERPPEYVWAQSGHWRGSQSGRVRHDGSVPTSRELSSVEAAIDIAPDYMNSPVLSALDPNSHRRNGVSQPSTGPADPGLALASKKAVKRRLMTNVDLNAIVAKRAKLDVVDPAKETGPTSSHPPAESAFDSAKYLADFVTANTGRTRTPAIKPGRGARLTSPELSHDHHPAAKQVHWRLNPLLHNSRWYTRAASLPPIPSSSDETPIKPVLACIGLMQNVLLITALKKQAFDIIDEDRPTLSGVDFAMSSTTGILFRPVHNLLHGAGDLLDDLGMAVQHYARVILVFEVKSYGIRLPEPDVGTGEAAVPMDDPDPLTPAIYRALGEFSDKVEEIKHRRGAEDGGGGDVKVVFGMNGPGEVARVTRAMADHTEKDCMAGEGSDWLEGTGGEEERILEHQFGVNLYASRAILARFKPFSAYMAKWTDQDAVDELGKVIGRGVAKKLVDKLFATEDAADMLG